LFALVFGVMALLVVGGMAAIAVVINRIVEGAPGSAALVWIAGCSLSVILPLMAVRTAIYGVTHIARPLSDVMSAADAVAGGDFSARVTETGEFRDLARSFNRMATELARADEQRRSLTADVAHELRTPLHILQGNIEGLIDGIYQPSPEHLNAMLEETHHLSRLVEDLRTLSLAESGHLPLHKERILAADLLADVATSFTAPAAAAEVMLDVQTDHLNGVMLEADPTRLNQILANLLTNALRHTPPSGKITLLGSADTGTLRLIVSDTGEGIPPEDLPYIFDRFWKGDPSRSRESASGSGLGLAIARQLVHLHGGRIEAQSQPGVGTIFTIDLPAVEQPDSQ
jgi:two-component system OmpR family sensor kinase/two-component system sensor histidine kinase BaeS